MSAGPRTPVVYGRDALIDSIRRELGTGVVIGLCAPGGESGMGLTTVARRVATVARARWVWSRPLDGPWPHRALRRALTTAGGPLPSQPTRDALIDAVGRAWRDQPPELIVLDGIGRSDAATAEAILSARPPQVPVLLTVDQDSVGRTLGARLHEVGPLDDEALARWLRDAGVTSHPMTRVWTTLAGGRPLVWSILCGGPLPVPPDEVDLDGPPALSAAYVARVVGLGRSPRRVLRILSVVARGQIDDARASGLTGLSAGPHLARLEESGLLVRPPTMQAYALPRGVADLAAQEALRDGLVSVVRDRQRSWVSDPRVATGSGLTDAVEVLRRLRSSRQEAAWSALCGRIGEAMAGQVPEAVDPSGDRLGDADGEPTRVMRRSSLLAAGSSGEIELELIDAPPVAPRRPEPVEPPPTDEVPLTEVAPASRGLRPRVAPMRPKGGGQTLMPAPEDEAPPETTQRLSRASLQDALKAADEEPTRSLRRPVIAADEEPTRSLRRPVVAADEEPTRSLRRPVVAADEEPTASFRSVEVVASVGTSGAGPDPQAAEETQSIPGRRGRSPRASHDLTPASLLERAHRLRVRLRRLEDAIGPEARSALEVAMRRVVGRAQASPERLEALMGAVEEADAAAHSGELAMVQAWAREGEEARDVLAVDLPVLPERPDLDAALPLWEAAQTARRDAVAAHQVARRSWESVTSGLSMDEARVRVRSARAASGVALDARLRLEGALGDLDSVEGRLREDALERFRAAEDEARAIAQAARSEVARLRDRLDPLVDDAWEELTEEVNQALTGLEALLKARHAPANEEALSLAELQRRVEIAEGHTDRLASMADEVRAACERSRDRLEAEASRRRQARAERVEQARTKIDEAREAFGELWESRPHPWDAVGYRALIASLESHRAVVQQASQVVSEDSGEPEDVEVAARRALRALDGGRRVLRALQLAERGQRGVLDDRRASEAIETCEQLRGLGARDWPSLRELGDRARALLAGGRGAEAHALRLAWGHFMELSEPPGPTTTRACRAMVQAMLAEVVLDGAGPPPGPENP